MFRFTNLLYLIRHTDRESDRRTDGWTDGRTDRQRISIFSVIASSRRPGVMDGVGRGSKVTLLPSSTPPSVIEAETSPTH